MAEREVNILFVDDSADDVLLFLVELERAHVKTRWARVDTPNGLEEALRDGSFDIAVVEYAMPGFGGPEALSMLTERCPEVPTIAVSGQVSEEVIVEVLRAGAYDYVLKSNRRRFVPAVQRAVQCRTSFLKHREAEAEIARLNHELEVKYEISRICLSKPDTDMYADVLDVVKRELGSNIGLFGYVNYRQELVCPSLTRDVWDSCKVADKNFIFPEEQWGGLWGRALRERQPMFSNGPLDVPEGHVQVDRAAAMPLLYQHRLLGLLMVANKASDYTTEDARFLQEIADHIAPILKARMDAARMEFQRSEAVAALRHSEARYRELFETMRNGVMVYRPVDDGRDFLVSEINRAGEEQTGIRRSDLVGRRVSQAFPGAEEMGLTEALRRVSSTGEPEHLNASHYRDSRTLEKWFDNYVYRLPTDEVVAVFDDITDRLLTQQELVDSEERYALAVEGANDGIWDWNLRTNEIYFSPRWKEMLGYADDELPNDISLWEEHIHPDDYAYTTAEVNEYLARGTGHLRLEFRMRHRDGSFRWILARAVAVRNEVGRSVRLTGAHADITDRKRAEAAREQAFAASVQRTSETEALLGAAKTVLNNEDFTAAARQIFNDACHLMGADSGYIALLTDDERESEVLFLEAGGRPCSVDPELPMPIRGLRGESYKMGRAVFENDFRKSEWQALMPPGHVDLDNVLFAPLNLGGKTVGLLGLANKAGRFTQRDARMAEAFGELAAIALRNSRNLTALRSSERKQREYSENLEVKVNDRTRELHQALRETILAKDQTDAIVRSVSDGLVVTDTGNRVLLMNPAAEAIFQVSADEVVGRSLETAIQHESLREKLLYTLDRRQTGHQFDFVLPDSDRERPRIMRAGTSVVWNRDGQEEGVVTIFHDVTRDREVDRMKTEFLSTAAHELKTPLTSIRGFSEILASRTDLPEAERLRFLDHIRRQSLALTDIVRDLLDISRIESGIGFVLERQTIPVAPLVERVVNEFQSLTSGHRLETDCAPTCSTIHADPGKLEQVLKNLLSNALKYSPNGGTIRVFGECSKDELALTVSDQGIGMSEEAVERIFDKFYRANATSTAVDGTGLGMSIVKHIVEAHGGRVQVRSQVGEGTSVTIRLPCQAPEQDDSSEMETIEDSEEILPDEGGAA